MLDFNFPAHWQIFPLRKFLKPISEKNFPDMPLLSVTRDNGIIIRNVESKEINHNFIPQDLSNYKLVRKGQFVINKMKAWQGSCGVSDYDGIVSPAYYVFELNFPCKKFFHYAIRSQNYIDIFAKLSIGIRVDQWDLPLQKIKQIPLPLPPRDEQEKIVRYLDKKTAQAQKIIDAKTKQVELLQELKRATISKAVTTGIFSAVTPDTWQKIKLKYLAKLNPSRKKIFEPNDKLSYAPMECVKSGYLISKEIFFKDLISGLTYFEEGDIILAKVTPCFENGNIAIAKNLINGAAYGSSELFVLRCFDVYKKFLFYFLQSSNFKNECISYMQGTAGLKRIPSKILMNYKISLPPLWEQKEIADYLDAKCGKIENLIEALQKEVELVRELQKSLIAEAVTGKIDLQKMEV